MPSSSFYPTRIPNLRTFLAIWAVFAAITPVATADEPPAGFRAILEEQTRKTFHVIADYVANHPQAEDVDAAYEWLFTAARMHHLESESLDLADAYLARAATLEAPAQLAREVQTIGLARAGKFDDALAEFSRATRRIGLREPNRALDLAEELAGEAQLGGDVPTARATFERLSAAFLLNPYVKSYADLRLSKLDLAGEAAPAISVQDLDGKPHDLSTYAGKVLLVDFWATNCPPCLEDFPEMKRMYARYHPQGLEVLGISLDDDSDLLRAFLADWKLPWPIAQSDADGGETRRRYHAAKIPSSFLVDRSGRVLAVDLRGAQLERAVGKALKATAD